MGYEITTDGQFRYFPDSCCAHCILSTGGAHQQGCPIYQQLVIDWRINPSYGQDEYIYYSPGILGNKGGSRP